MCASFARVRECAMLKTKISHAHPLILSLVVIRVYTTITTPTLSSALCAILALVRHTAPNSHLACRAGKATVVIGAGGNRCCVGQAGWIIELRQADATEGSSLLLGEPTGRHCTHHNVYMLHPQPVHSLSSASIPYLNLCPLSSSSAFFIFILIIYVLYPQPLHSLSAASIL
jgi:hypothetical protein